MDSKVYCVLTLPFPKILSFELLLVQIATFLEKSLSTLCKKGSKLTYKGYYENLILFLGFLWDCYHSGFSYLYEVRRITLSRGNCLEINYRVDKRLKEMVEKLKEFQFVIEKKE